jgi:transcription elongation factor Elf1
MSDVAIETLKRCPFCGSKDVGPWDDQTPSTIECYSCLVVGPEVPQEEPGSMTRGRDYWNSRGAISGLAQFSPEEPGPGSVPLVFDLAAALPCPFCGSKKLAGTCDTLEQSQKVAAIVHPDDPDRAAESVEYDKACGHLSCASCGTMMVVEKADPLKEWNFRMPVPSEFDK